MDRHFVRRCAQAAAALGGIGVTAAVASAIAARRWNGTTERIVSGLCETGHPAAPRTDSRVSFASLASLPPPVARYLRSALVEGQPYIRTARVVQRGTFNMSAPREGWRRYDATQFFELAGPGYVWDANIHVAPFVSVRVRDAYAEGRGTMDGAVLALVTVVNEHDKRELDIGALQRYLAETPWFPTSLLPGGGVTWSAVDDSHAEAAIADGATSASLSFEFGGNGDVVAVSSPRRFRVQNGRFEALPWGGAFSQYATRGGMRVPLQAEVYWTTERGDEPYIRIGLTDLRYKFAE